MKDLHAVFKSLARRYHARWSRIDDALTLIRSHSGANTAEGERTRRTLNNAFRAQTYPDDIRDSLQTDRANALRKLGGPLNEALGHILTIELADEMLETLKSAERQRSCERSDAGEIEKRDTIYGPFIECLHRHGIVRGHHEILTENEWNVVARYIRQKVEQRVGHLPPIRTAQEMRSLNGRLHPFWNPYSLSRDGKITAAPS